MAYDIERLYKDLTGRKIETEAGPGKSYDVILSNINGIPVPQGTKATYLPEGSPLDILVTDGYNSIGISASGYKQIDVGKNAPKNISELLNSYLNDYLVDEEAAIMVEPEVPLLIAR